MVGKKRKYSARKVVGFFREKAKRRLFLPMFGIFLFLVLLFYGTTLQNGFVHDDIGQVVQNEDVQSLSHLPKVVTSCIWKFELGDCITYYRPVQSLSYLLTYQISSHPLAFHLVQLLFVAAAVFAVFFLVYVLAKQTLLALLAALFFLIHPINTEAVNWISALPDIAYTLFAALAFAFYISYTRRLKKVSLRGILRSERNLKTAYRKFFESARLLSKERLLLLAKAHRKLLFAVLFYFLAMLAKEPAVLLPILFLFFDAFVERVSWRGFVHPFAVARYTLLAIPLLVYGAMRTAVLEGFGDGSGYYGTFSIAERVHAFVTLFAQYLGKLFVPYPLNFFYPFSKSSDFLSPAFLLSLLVLIAFAASVAWAVKKRLYLAGLFLLWIAVFLSPVLLALNSVGENVFSERYLFAPSAGFAFLLAYGVVWITQFRKGAYRKYVIGAVVILAAVSWGAVFERNKAWKDDFTLYAKTLEQNPRADSIRRNLAVELTEKGRYEEAVQQLESIIASNPEWADIAKAYNNLGEAHRLQGDYDEALEAYGKGVEVSGGKDYRAFNNIGAVRFEQGEYLKSLLSLCRAVQLDPAAPEVQRNLDRLLPVFQSVKEENLHLLAKDIQESGVFARREGGVQTIRSECRESECELAFQARLRDREMLFPFLILGSEPDGSSFRPQGSSFDQQQGIISLKIDSAYALERVSFIFPSCEQVFYEAEANLKDRTDGK